MGKINFIIAVLLFVTVSTRGDDWPKWLGPLESGQSPEALPAEVQLELAWESQIGTGFSSFAVGQGKVFAMGYQDGQETVFCFSEPDGKVLWKHSYSADLMPNLHEGGPNATPTIDGDRVYTISKDGQLRCLSTADGTLHWQKNMQKEAGLYRPPEWGFGGSPYIMKDKVIVEAGFTIAYQKESGTEIWRSKKYRPAYGSPILFSRESRDYLAVLKTDGLVILDPGDGGSLGFAQWRTSFQTNATTPLIAGEGRLFISTGYDRGCALFDFDGTRLTKVYETKTMCNHMGNSVLLGEHLYGFDGTAHRGRPVEFCCVQMEDGVKLWSTMEYRYGSVIAAGNDLIVLSERGELLIGGASPEGFSPRTQKQILRGRCWTPPVVANGKIFARNAAGHMVVWNTK